MEAPILRTEIMEKFRKSEDGSVAVIVALLLTVLLGFAALGVDMASLYRARAQLQSVSDLAALSAMANPSAATSRATETLVRNGKPEEALASLQTGRFLRNPAILAANRFEELPSGSAGINAVRLVLENDAPLHFAQIFTEDTAITLDRTSLSTRTGGASFSLTSHVINISDANLNALLAQHFGASAAFSVNDISVLGDASFNLRDLLDALDVPQNRNPADVLNAVTSIGDIIAAAQSILPPGTADRLNGLGAGSAALSVASLVGGIDTELGLTATDFLAHIDISALDLVKAILAAGADDDGVTLAAPMNVAGVLDVDVALAAGEPPAQSGWIALDEEGVQLHRAAVRLKADIATDTGLLGTFATGLQIASINLPIYTELAGSTATLDEINCNVSVSQDVAARFLTSPTDLHPNNGSSVAALYLGELPDTAGPIDPDTLEFADLLTVNIVIPLLLTNIEIAGLTIQARGHIAVGASQTETISFTHADVAAGATTRSFGSGDLLASSIGSLLSQNTQFRVKPGQEGLVSGVAGPLVADLLDALPGRLLSGLVTPVDAVIDATLANVGHEVGAGELTLTGHHCEPIRLVR